MNWIKVEDSMPELKVPILLFIPDENNYIAYGILDKKDEWLVFGRKVNSSVTHWMYLPNPPIKEQ